MPHTYAEWTVVKNCLRLPEALLVRSVLEGEGPDVLIPDEHALGYQPGAETALGGARVMVRAGDLEQAQGILRAMDATQAESGSS